MDNLTNAIMKYIESEDKPSYAIMIDGEWGSGKTFFWKNYIESKIRTINGMKPIYVSLYGVESTAEISRRLFFESMKILDSKNVSRFWDSRFVRWFRTSRPVALVSNISYAFGGILKAVRFGNGIINMDISVLAREGIDWEQFNQAKTGCIMCFDDMERSQIPLGELLGFLNDYVEHKNFKIVLIGNEKEISVLPDNSDIASYKRIKEKIVGRTYSFPPKGFENDEVVKEIINSDFTDDYGQFLASNVELVLETMNRAETKNLRVIRRSIMDFHVLFRSLQPCAQEFVTNNERLEESFLLDTMKKYFEFYLAISIGHFSGDINGELHQELVSYESRPYYQLLSDDTKRTELRKNSPFLKRLNLFDSNKYWFSVCVCQYVIKGFLDENYLRDEIDEIVRAELRQQRPDELLEVAFSLPDAQFADVINQVIRNIAESHYKLNQYVRLYERLDEFDQAGLIPDLGEDKLKTLFKSGISNVSLRGIDFAVDKKDLEVLKRIRPSVPEWIYKSIEDRYCELEREYRQKTVRKLFSLVSSDFDEFYDEVAYNTTYQEVALFEVAEYNDLKVLVDSMVNTDNNVWLLDFQRAMQARYSDMDRCIIEAEKENLIVLTGLMQSYLNDLPDDSTLPMRRYMVQTNIDFIHQLVSVAGVDMHSL